MSIPQVEAVEGREDTATRFVRMGRGMAAIVTHAQAGEADIRLYPLSFISTQDTCIFCSLLDSCVLNLICVTFHCNAEFKR